MIFFLVEWGETLMCSGQGKNWPRRIGNYRFGRGLIDREYGFVLDFRILVIELLNQPIGFLFFKTFGSPASAAV